MPSFNFDPSLPSIEEVENNGGKSKTTLAQESRIVKNLEDFFTEVLKKVGSAISFFLF